MSQSARTRRITLPSQRVVQVSLGRTRGDRPRSDRPRSDRPRSDRPRSDRPRSKKNTPLFADVLALFTSGAITIDEDGRRLDPAAIDALALADFHVLRDLAIREKLVPSEEERFPCDNCDAPLVLVPAALPARDLEERYEDEEPLVARTVTLTDAVSIGDRSASRVRMRPVTVAEARPLWRELGRDRAFEITPALLRAMGVEALVDAQGEAITDLRSVARALGRASDASWSDVEDAFLALAYPPRAITTIVCPRCETVHDLEVPWPRELEPGQYHPLPSRDEAFPEPAALEARARAIADATWRKMDAGGLTLRIELGVPEVDSGGVPMLGSYTPEPRDDGGTDFVVRVYYRTFERAFQTDAGFDWEHELEETIEHEAQHHLYYLAGHDPMDAEERAESERELVRRVGGEKRYRRLQREALLRSLWEIVRVLVPSLLLVALAVVILSRCVD